MDFFANLHVQVMVLYQNPLVFSPGKKRAVRSNTYYFRNAVFSFARVRKMFQRMPVHADQPQEEKQRIRTIKAGKLGFPSCDTCTPVFRRDTSQQHVVFKPLLDRPPPRANSTCSFRSGFPRGLAGKRLAQRESQLKKPGWFFFTLICLLLLFPPLGPFVVHISWPTPATVLY